MGQSKTVILYRKRIVFFHPHKIHSGVMKERDDQACEASAIVTAPWNQSMLSRAHLNYLPEKLLELIHQQQQPHFETTEGRVCVFVCCCCVGERGCLPVYNSWHITLAHSDTPEIAESTLWCESESR